MKTTKLMRGTLCAAILAALVLVGCDELEPYSIDAPSDLQSKIDSIADAKANMDTGDTTYIDIVTGIVGNEDYSSAWNTAFSDYFEIPANSLLQLEFINHNGGGVNNWNNWTLAVTNVAERDADTYEEYFAMRSDAYGWGNDDFDLALVSHNYPDTDGDDDIWNDFRTTMDGAFVTLKIDHSVSGYAFLTATAVGTNGTELVMTYQQPIPVVDKIQAFLICDASYFEMQRAYLLPSEVTIVEDVAPVSLTITGTSAMVEIGDSNFWGDAVATVTFADGSSNEVDSADLSFSVVPDMTTLGEKTVAVAYSKTKQGAYSQAVTAIYTLKVVNPVASLAVTTNPYLTEYYFVDDTLDIQFDPSGMEITATYNDGTTGIIPNESFMFSSISPVAGAQDVTVSYFGANDTTTTTVPLNIVKGTAQVGATDFSTGWWTVFSSDVAVASGTSVTTTLHLYSNEVNSYHSPCTILRNADASQEYAVVRMDNFGWGDFGYPTATLTNDWDLDVFASQLNGSSMDITVTNNGDDTADVRYDVTYANGETHFQLYEGITIASADLVTALVLEGSYIVIVE